MLAYSLHLFLIKFKAQALHLQAKWLNWIWSACTSKKNRLYAASLP